jgi:hypothetical protein
MLQATTDGADSMPKVQFECLYCGHEFYEYLYDPSQAEEVKCERCKDENLKVRVQENTDVFGYHFDEKKRGKN